MVLPLSVILESSIWLPPMPFKTVLFVGQVIDPLESLGPEINPEAYPSVVDS